MKLFNFFRKDPNQNTNPNSNQPSQNTSSNQSTSLKLQYQTEITKEEDNLNELIKQFNIDKKQLSSYEDFFNLENEIISRKNEEKKVFYQNELDYLYAQKTKKDPKTAKNNVEKMKTVGKIYTSDTTFFDINDVGRNNAKISYNKLKIESLNYFLSIMANNCVISGKWCYEVTLLTNGLMQIGFCQLNSAFTRHSGVGDDKTSYAYDGYRKLSWNADRKMYGRFWDCGDVVGVCIDLDKKNIEYFLNGISLGIAFFNIQKGENIAYFPAISLQRGEAVIFNFGQMPFKYEYKGYQSFDTPISKINKINVIISDLLNIWGKNILPLLISSKISEYQILLLSSDIFNLISQYINDIYIFHKSILPFLIELKTTKISPLNENNNYSFSKFILSILETISDNEAKKNIGYEIYEYLSIEILENSLRMGNFIKIGEIELKQKLSYYENLMKVFISMLQCDKITSILMEKGTLEVFKNIFNCNWFHSGDLLEYLYINHKDILKSSLSVKAAIKELKKQNIDSNEKYFYKINQTISKQLSNIIYIFLTDQRKLFNGKILKDEFNDLIKRGYSMVDNNEVVLNILGLGNKLSRQEPIFLRNIFMNLIYMFDEHFLNENFEDMSTYPWFYRSAQNSIYFDEVGIGGTISHVTTEYANKVPDNLVIKSDKFGQDFFHKLIHMINDLFINGAFKKFEDFYNKSNNTSISDYVKINDNGTIKFGITIRNYFYVYPYVIQIALYKMAFFIIKYLMYLIKKNEYIIYFIPSSVTEIPFAFFKLLINLKSSIFFDKTLRLNINKCSKHFEKDDFVQNLIEFYLILFSDDKIANPELKESFLKKVNFLLEKKILEEFYEEDEQIFERLIKGLLKDLKGDTLSHNASKILLKIISPICFGYKLSSKHKSIEKNKYYFNTNKISPSKKSKDKTEKNKTTENYKYNESTATEKLKKYFEGNFQLFDEFLKSYGSILNKVMTNYSMALSSIMEIGVNNLDVNKTELNHHLLEHHIQPQSDRALFQGLSSSYNEMCQLLKIYEFLILIYPDEFLDPKKLNYINFINVLKNISTRILSPPYIEQILQLIKVINPKVNSKIIIEKNKIDIYQIGLSIAGIFIQIHKWRKKNNFYESFCKETANIPDLNIDPFNLFIKHVLDELKNLQNKDKENIIKEIETEYIQIIEYLLSLRNVKELTNDEMDELISQDKLCLLCYEHPSNTELIPCKHRCCLTCYNQYKIDKDVCFICQQKIESVNIINNK